MPVHRALAGLGMLALGAGLCLIAASRPGPSITVQGPERPIAAGAGDAPGARANNSPTLVRSPVDRRFLVVVNRVDLPQYACAMHQSHDGGRTWREGAIPFPAGQELPERCFAPDAAFGADGALYVVFATLTGAGNTPHAIWVSSMERGGHALSEPRKVLDRLAFQVRVTADPRRPGGLYLSWLQASEVGVALFPNTGNPINVARSDDGGDTWSEPVRVSPPSRLRVVAPSLVVGDGEDLWVLYVDLRDDKLDYHGGHEWRAGEPYAGRWSLVLARSADRGSSWHETVVDPGVVPTERFLVFLPQSPSLAVDVDRGRVYVGFADGRLGDPDVWLRASRDGGETFEQRRRVNDTPRRDGTSQYLPKLAVGPDGRLDAVYYDRRADPDNVMNGVSFQSSFDGGRSFTASLRLSKVTFDSRIGFGSTRGLPDLGSRLALLSEDERALAVWTDTRAGTEQSRRQDLAMGTVDVEQEDALRDPLSAAGRATAGVGLLVLGSAAATAVRRRPRTGREGRNRRFYVPSRLVRLSTMWFHFGYVSK